AGMEVRAIGGVTASTLVATMLAATPADGDIETARLRRSEGWAFSERLVTLLGLGSPYAVLLRDPRTGREERVSLRGLSGRELRARSEARHGNDPADRTARRAADFQLVAGKGGCIGVLTIRAFEETITPGGETMVDFLQRSFDELGRRKARALVL